MIAERENESFRQEGAQQHARIQQNEALCADCGRCVRECAQGVFAFDGDGFVYIAAASACIGCGICIKYCGLGALELLV